VFRAILEGIALEQRLVLSAIERAVGTQLEQVRVLGGGAGSGLWCQILADALGCSVVRTRSSEATSLGAAALAGVGVGLFESISQASAALCGSGAEFAPGPQRAAYDELFAIYEKLYPILASSLRDLARVRRSQAGKGTQ
jgi:xylulokinase